MEFLESLFLAALFVFPAYLISLGVTGTESRRKKALEKAISAGHVVTAVLIRKSSRHWNVPGLTTPGPHRRGTYEYEYKGKKYRYRFWSDNPPSTLKLYFIKNPGKATVAGAMYDSTISWPLVYLVVAVFWYL